MTHREIARFWRRVTRTATCWLFGGALDVGGYGRFYATSFGRRTRKAHRVAWELLRGPVPGGLALDHLCRVRACVNPDHLDPVTTRVNVLRGVGPCAKNSQRTHCASGHAFDSSNTYYRRTGGRACRTCDRGRKIPEVKP